jgi:hypothetical protein
MTTKKINWAEIDKRIRSRRTSWTNDELKSLEDALEKLPDLAGRFDVLDIPQPARLINPSGNQGGGAPN